jgi:hypothetical protein
MAARQTPALDDAEIAMLFAVLAPLARLQVHAEMILPPPVRRKRVGLPYTALEGLTRQNTNDSAEKNLRMPEIGDDLRKSG